MSMTSFRDLEIQMQLPEYQPGDSALEEWYESIRDTPIEEFEDDDLCRAVRQQIFLSFLLPIAVSRLKNDPTIGGIYDGELLVSFRSLPPSFWKENPAEACAVRMAALRVQAEDVGQEVIENVKQLLLKLESK